VHPKQSGGDVTAEIAILNKTAVALAADSAVTISIGTDQQKVYDSEDKLFELSRHDPIGVMINSNMHFMDAPLPVLIKRYRSACPSFKNVPEAALSFLNYLRDFGADAPPSVSSAALERTLDPVWKLVSDRFNDKYNDRMQNLDWSTIEDGSAYFNDLRKTVLLEQIRAVHRLIEALPETQFIGDEIDDVDIFVGVVAELIGSYFSEADGETVEALSALADLILTRRVFLSPHTGVIVAGFGTDELFPSLVSYEVFGTVRGQLRIFKTNDVDIDRGGTRAKVIPFAQKEMVERFLYGLDDSIERKITEFCKQSVPSIREQTVEHLLMEDADRIALETDMKQAEEAFLDGLREQTFNVIRQQSEEEIEDMVEFMPKSEMARMAEALVNLTSIKRRVSRGMETVGGPIDCAVISQADGFIWVNRKHYFAAELNSRYFDRMREQCSQPKEA
jgi:hypothetical protein